VRSRRPTARAAAYFVALTAKNRSARHTFVREFKARSGSVAAEAIPRFHPFPLVPSSFPVSLGVRCAHPRASSPPVVARAEPRKSYQTAPPTLKSMGGRRGATRPAIPASVVCTDRDGGTFLTITAGAGRAPRERLREDRRGRADHASAHRLFVGGAASQPQAIARGQGYVTCYVKTAPR